jgi:hypothetical protein
VNVSLYLENRIKGLTLATSATYQHLSALAANYSEGAISCLPYYQAKKKTQKNESMEAEPSDQRNGWGVLFTSP